MPPAARHAYPTPGDAYPAPGEGLPAPADVALLAREQVSAEAAVLRRRAMESAVTAYSAMHGHPLDHGAATDTSRARWAAGTRVALAAAVVLAALTALVVGRTLAHPSTVVQVGGSADDIGHLQLPTPLPGTGEPGVGSAGGSAAAGAGPGVGEPDAGSGSAGGTAAGTGQGNAASGARVVVHVVGQVGHPGLVELAAGARVAEAIEAAGGAGAEADLAALNLARVLTDGEQVHVPRPGEVVATPVPGTGAGAGPTPGAAGVLLDLNTADLAALDALPGLGPVLAQRVLDWRAEHGRFTSVEELTEVTGIGPSLMAGLRDLVRV